MPPAACSKTCVSASSGTCGPAHGVAGMGQGVVSAVGSREGCGRSREVSISRSGGLAACSVYSVLGMDGPWRRWGCASGL